MSRDLLEGWGEARLGLSHDPCWAGYWRWGWDRLPLTFPSCTVEVDMRPLERPGLSVTVHLDGDLPMVCRIDDGEGRVLGEQAPQTAPGSLSLDLAAGDLPAVLGLGFEWVFFTPVRRFQPTKPLGVVLTPTDRIAGRRLDVSVRRKTVQEPVEAVR